MDAQIPLSQEQLQRQSLARFRLIATGMLLVMALLFTLTHVIPIQNFWISLLRAGSEAAMVGGLADWFAVTALFRHPLGLPIPHTAVLPKNKDRLAEGIGNFVERHFLEPELLSAKLRSINVAERLSQWLSRPDVSAQLADRIVGAIPHILNSVSDRQIRDFFKRALEDELKEIDLPALMSNILALVRDSDQHHELLDHALVAGRRYLEENRETIFGMVTERSRWWVPSTVDRRIAEALVDGIAELLGDLSHRDRRVRREFDAAFAGLVDKLKHDPDTRGKASDMQKRLFESETVQRYLLSFWEHLRQRLTDPASSQGDTLKQALAEAIRSIARALSKDENIQGRFNRWILAMVRDNIAPWRHEIGLFIREVVDSWETETLTERVELAVGRDLQFIRMNGTIVGGIVGCGLFLLSSLLEF
ncbi:DUF445 domain-containing protein [Emcibacter nanhaiensis]|uniref:DUF445 domain-containing protein n=1 Tax=Emcibacter nanhaiensis TaxID=1505037 RepID=A0A501PG71_9PROT|nr:DUF445 domain-containing protein [Emcibacter nanhaiensis]TPD58886.1 DUF445 domain-containing protein [Emcibacter nanhaiensis]